VTERAEELFLSALDIDPADRPFFLDETCSEDAALRAEVELLLAAHEGLGDFLQVPAADRLGVSRPEVPDLEPDARVGDYRILSRLDSGGAATVYEAMQRSPRRRVALKVMRTGFGSEAAFRRFLDEGEILARLTHPDIAHVYAAGEHEQEGIRLPYIALEFLETARSIVRYAGDEGLDSRARLSLMARVCDAIHHGHEKGIIHRDVKPGNLLVDGAGHLKVIDFGIARAAEEAGDPTIAGTLPYMSPEQFDPEGEGVDIRSDVYSLGVVTNELLTGRLPTGIPPEPDRELRGDLRAIVAKAVSRNRERRYASAAALADDIRRHLEDRPVEARPPSLLYQGAKFARRRRAAFTAVILVFLVSILGAVIAASYAVRSERARATAEAARGEAERQAYVANIAAASAALRVDDVAEARHRLDRAPRDLRNWEWDYLRSRLDDSDGVIASFPGYFWVGAVSPDGGRVIVSRSIRFRDQDVRLYDLASGEALWSRTMDEERIDSFAFSPKGDKVAIGSTIGNLSILSATDGRMLSSLRAHPSAVNAILWHPDGRLLATASRDTTVGLFDPRTLARVGTLEGHSDRVICLDLFPDGSRLATGGREGEIRIWDLRRRETIARLRGHEGSVEGLAFSPDGTQLASASRDETVRLWDVRSGSVIHEGRGHRANVRSVTFAPDGRHYVSGGWDRTIRVWSVSSGRGVACLRGHEGPVHSVLFTGRGNQLVSTSMDGTIRTWSARPRPDVPVLAGHDNLVTCVAFRDDGSLLASGSRDGTVRLWDPEKRTAVAVLRPHGGVIGSLRFLSDGRRIEFTVDSRREIWSVAERRRVALRRGHLEAVTWESPGGPWNIGAFREAGDMRAVHARTDRVIATWRAHADRIDATALSGSVLASGCRDGRIRLWRLPGRGRIAQSEGNGSAVIVLSFRPDGAALVAGTRNGEILVMDPDTLEVRMRLAGHSRRVSALTFAPDGSRLVSGGADGTIRLWDLEHGLQVAVLRGDSYGVTSLAFSPDGRRLASGGGVWDGAGEVLLWEIPETAGGKR